MGNVPSDAACSSMMGFLISWHARQLGVELTGARGVLRKDYGLAEGEEDRFQILSLDSLDGGGWRIEVRLSNGAQTVVSDPKSFQGAMAKARLKERDLGTKTKRTRQKGGPHEYPCAT